MSESHHICLEFARADEVEDPYAIRMGRQEYVLRGEGGTFEGTSLRWSEALLAELAALSLPEPDPEAVQAMGSRLREFLEPTGWEARERELLAAQAAGQRAIVTIRSAAAELYALPFELLTLSTSGQHLGELPGLLVRYEWPGTASAPPQPDPPAAGGRILYAWSSAGGEVPVSAHLRALHEGARAGQLEPDAVIELGHASLAGIDAALSQAREQGEPAAVLHLLCHGAAAGQAVGLALDSPEGEEVVDAGRLRRVLGPHAHDLRCVVLCACRGSDPGALGTQLGSVAQALHRAGIEAVIASRFPLSVAGSVELAGTFYAQLLGQLASVPSALEAARRSISASERSLDWASLQLYAHAEEGEEQRPIVFRPYRGLLPFRVHDRRFFFGREQECAAVLGRIDAMLQAEGPRLLAVAGASGSGKSSVVMAGVLPSLLEREQQWVYTLTRPTLGASPIQVLVDELCKAVPGIQGSLEEVLDSIEAQAESLRVLVLIDQFEEIFSTPEGEAFARLLWALARRPELPLVVVATMRIDFLGRCSELAVDDAGTRLDMVLYEDQHHFFVGHLGPEALERVIRAPAEAVGLRLEPGLVEALVRGAGDEAGALPLLEYALDLLWRNRSGGALSVASYEAFGSIEGALTRTADELLEGMSAEQLEQARRLLLALVDVQQEGVRTRRRVRREEVLPSDAADRRAFEAATEQLLVGRLVVAGELGGAGEVWYDIAHEALLRRWGRLLDWIEADRVKLLAIRKLAGWTREWDSAGREGYLLEDHRLGFAQSVRADYGERELSTDILALLRASERAALRRRLWLGAGVLALLLGVLAFAGLQSYQRRDAEQLKEKADAAREAARHNAQTASNTQRVASNLSRVNAARVVRRIDPTLGLLLLRGAEIEPGDEPIGWRRGAAISLLIPTSSAVLRGHQQSVNTARFSPSGAQILTTSLDQSARLWTRGGVEIARMEHGADVRIGVFSPTGQRVFTGTASGEVWSWDPRAPDSAVLLGTHGSTLGQALTALALDPKGERLLSASADGSVRLWGLSEGGRGEQLWSHEHDAEVSTACFDPEATRLLSAAGAQISMWELSELQAELDGGAPAEPRVLDRHTGAITSLSFSPDARLLLSSSADHSAIVWALDAEHGPAPTVLDGHSEAVLDAAFNPAGTRVVTGSADSTVQVWTLTDEGPRRDFEFDDILNVVTRVAFTPDGEHVLGVADDGQACMWSAEPGGSEVPLELSGHLNLIGDIDFARVDGQEYLLSASNDASARVWNIDSFDAWLELDDDALPIRSVAWSGEQLATATSAGVVKLWSAAGEGPLLEYRHSGAASVTDVEFDRAGQRFAASGEDGRVSIVSLASPDRGERRALLDDGGDAVTSVAWSPSPDRPDLLLTAQSSGTLALWDVSAAPEEHELGDGETESAIVEPLREIHTGSAKIWSAQFAPSGLFLLAAADDGRLQFFALDGSKMPSYPDHVLGSTIYAAEFSPEGERVVLSTQKGGIHLLDLASQERQELEGHSAPVLDVHFSSDGQTLVTGSLDGTVGVWRLGEAGQAPRAFFIEGGGGPVRSIALDEAGTRVLAGTDSDAAHIWTLTDFELGEAELRAQLERATSACIPPSTRMGVLGEDKFEAQLKFGLCEEQRNRASLVLAFERLYRAARAPLAAFTSGAG